MTAANIAKFRNDPNAPFWKNLKEGSDYFEALRGEPRVGVCGTKYVFGGADAAAGSCTPKVEPQVAEKRERDNQEVAELIAKGVPATRLVYDDGSQNPVFRKNQTPANTLTFASLGKPELELPVDPKDYAQHKLGDVSRPESLAAEREVEVDAKGRPVMMAAAAPIPTKAAAVNLARKGAAPAAKPEPIMAEPAKPARVLVADADGDPAAYKKVLGNLFSNGTPATPAADAATVPSAAAAEPIKLAAKAEPRHASSKPAPHAALASSKAKAATDDKAAKPALKAASAIPSPKTTGSTVPKN